MGAIVSTATHNCGSGHMVMITMRYPTTGKKLKNLLRMLLMLYTRFMEQFLIPSTLQTYTLLQELLMIGTEVVLKPDMPSPLNSEILDTTDSNCQHLKSFLVEKNSLPA